MLNALYICYFGIRQPLVQTQVVPYLQEICKGGTVVTLLTFEPNFSEEWDAKQIELEKERMVSKGIEWQCLAYHKRFSVIATAYDVFAGARFIRQMIAAKNIDILHGRVHVPTLMGALARRFSKQKPKLLFDIRGFFPEEYTDAGVWTENGFIYRTVKRIEKWLMKEADGFVVLTEKARAILFPESAENGFDKKGRPVEVIPCCVDLNRFRSANENSRINLREKLDISTKFVVTYIGSFGGWYLTEETADFFGEMKRGNQNSFALILTQSDPEVIVPLLRERGLTESDFLVTRVSPIEIPQYLGAADASLSFIKPCYSKQASSPTKNAEYLACGLPIIANSGVGDVDHLINDNNVGALVKDFKPESYRSALREIETLGDVGEHCRQVAHDQFDLATVGGFRYRRLYEKLLSREVKAQGLAGTKSIG